MSFEFTISGRSASMRRITTREYEGKCTMKYVGLMKDNAPMGHGTQSNADGTIEYSGEWDNGRPINKEEPENVS